MIVSHLRQFLNSELAVKLYHFLDDLVLGAVEVRVVLELPWVVPALLCDPLLLSWLELALELAVVLANDSLGRIVEAVADIVGTLRYMLKAINIVAYQRLAVGPQALHLLRVEASVLDRAVVPLLVFELEVIIEEVLARDQLSSVPFGNVTTLKFE